MDLIPYKSGLYYIFDRGYVDFTKLHKITNHSAYFVIRAKPNLKFNRISSNKVDKTTGVQCDQVGKLYRF